MILNEYTKKQLVNRSKVPILGRFKRRLQISDSDISLNEIKLVNNTNGFKDLVLEFLVRDYVVILQLANFTETLINLIRNENRNNQTMRVLLDQAVSKSLSKRVRVSCTCKDFYYRYSFTATKLDFGYNTNQYIPARIRNPKNLGAGCKHIIRVLNAPSLWKRDVVSSLNRSIKDDPAIIIRR